MVTNIADLQIQDDFLVTISGTVIGIDEDEFLLRDSTGQVWVELEGRGNGFLDLSVGETVTVVGDLDDPEDFDAIQITTADGSEIIGQPFPDDDDDFDFDFDNDDRPTEIGSAPFFNIADLQIRDDFLVTISGTVVSIDEDEFLLRDSTGQVWVEPEGPGNGTVDLSIGETVTVIGDLDDPEDFDAIQIIDASGRDLLTGDNFDDDDYDDDDDDYDDDDDDYDDDDDFEDFVQFQGTVGQVWEDGFLLNTSTFTVPVDSWDLYGDNTPSFVSTGNFITVTGEFDEGELDAFNIF